MLVRCPECKAQFRLVEDRPGERVVRYLCPGCETIVSVDLALDEVQSSSSAASYRGLERAKTVLVADDARTTLEMAGDLLRDAGFNVILATDGIEALQVIRERHPDLVVLDLLMPRMTGFDVLREMQQDERISGTPVMAMSGVYRDNVVEFLQELGARGFMEKTQLEETLVFRTRQILEAAS
jgi:predicted Zn finger-like uncharacterized protein